MTVSRRSFSALGAFSIMATAADAMKPVRAAMVGTGHGHANSKARSLRQMPEFSFAGACRPDDRDPIRGPEFQNVEWLSLAQLLEDATIEMVAVEGADPAANLNYAWRCVNASKHVHLDKPPGADFSRLRDLFSEAARRSLFVQIGYQWRYHPGMLALHEAARNGWLGDIYRFRASIDKPILADERRELAHYKGGMMFSEGCHLIDQATALLGEPQSVSGFLQHRSPIDDGLIDNALAVLRYPHALAEVSMAGFDPFGNVHRYVEVLGSNGLARVSPFSPLRLQVKLQSAAGPYAAGDQHLKLENPDGYPYRPDFVELAGCIRGVRQPRFSFQHDLMTHKVLLDVCGMLTG
jgi:predicted dehydrogenase